jgi:hypothetical protein
MRGLPLIALFAGGHIALSPIWVRVESRPTASAFWRLPGVPLSGFFFSLQNKELLSQQFRATRHRIRLDRVLALVDQVHRLASTLWRTSLPFLSRSRHGCCGNSDSLFLAALRQRCRLGCSCQASPVRHMHSSGTGWACFRCSMVVY